MNNNTIKLAIVDDQKLFLNGLKFIIETFEGIELIIEAHDGEDFIQKIKDKTPDVVLLDLKMPIMDGVETTKYLKVHHPDIKILLLTMYNDERFITHLMELGANGYLLKDEEPEIVEEAIRTVVQKGFYFNDYVSKALLTGVKVKNNKALPGFTSNDKLNLTKRELEVLQLICQELTTSEIAQKLFISIRTVEGHRKNLLEKTGVRNMAGLVIYAMKHKLISVV
ncbi:MAG: response regulator transcription factor [Bacteroidota bacterium]